MRAVLLSGLLLLSVGCGGDRARSPGTRQDTVADAGASGGDRGAPDGGPPVDGGPAARDAGAADAGTMDAGAMDAGAMDAGAMDAGAGGAACPVASGFTGVGRRWRNRSTAAYEAESGYQFTGESEIVGFTDLGTHIEVRVEGTNHVFGTTNGVSYTADTQTTVVYRCDGAGMAIVSQASTSQSTYDGSRTDSSSTLTYTPPLLMLPASLQIGQRWTARASQRSAGVSAGQPYDQTTAVSYEAVVTGQTSVTMPAGTFPAAWRIDRDWGGYTDQSLYADEVGYLGNQSSELVGYQ